MQKSIEVSNESNQKKDKKIILDINVIREGNLEKIESLLAEGADINSTDKKGKTALW